MSTSNVGFFRFYGFEVTYGVYLVGAWCSECLFSFRRSGGAVWRVMVQFQFYRYGRGRYLVGVNCYQAGRLVLAQRSLYSVSYRFFFVGRLSRDVVASRQLSSIFSGNAFYFAFGGSKFCCVRMMRSNGSFCCLSLRVLTLYCR